MCQQKHRDHCNEELMVMVMLNSSSQHDLKEIPILPFPDMCSEKKIIAM